MKPFLWITACCAGLTAFQVPADEDYAPQSGPYTAPGTQGDKWTAPPPPPASSDRSQHPSTEGEHGYRYGAGPDYGAMPGYHDPDATPRHPQGTPPDLAPYHQMPPEPKGFEPSRPKGYSTDRVWTGGPGPRGYPVDPGYGYLPPQTDQMPYGYEDSPDYGYAPPQTYRMPYPDYGYAPPQTYRMPYGHEDSPGYGYPDPDYQQRMPDYGLDYGYDALPGGTDYGYPPYQTPPGAPDYSSPYGPQDYGRFPGYPMPEGESGYRPGGFDSARDYNAPPAPGRDRPLPPYGPQGYDRFPGYPMSEGESGYGPGGFDSARDYNVPPAPGHDRPLPPYGPQGYDRFPGYPMSERESGYGPGGFDSARDYNVPPAPGHDRPLPPYGIPSESDQGFPPPDYPMPTAPYGADPFARPLPPAPASAEGEALATPQPVAPGVSTPATETAVEDILPPSSLSEDRSEPAMPIPPEQPAFAPPAVQGMDTSSPQTTEPQEPMSEGSEPAMKEPGAVSEEPEPTVEDSAPEPAEKRET